MIALLSSGPRVSGCPGEVAWVAADLSQGYSACIRPPSTDGEDVGTVASHLNLSLGCLLVGQSVVKVLTDVRCVDAFCHLFDAAGLPMDFDLVNVGSDQLHREHADLVGGMAAECALVERRALDNALIHALSFAAADLLDMPSAARVTARSDITRRASALKWAVVKAQASRLNKLH